MKAAPQHVLRNQNLAWGVQKALDANKNQATLLGGAPGLPFLLVGYWGPMARALHGKLWGMETTGCT